mmetsp:Transcript_34354/g.67585  ORF Transcript_34354/g.67585 Transcript_34354/m.67585 type:complete len:83 (+) Transcript_34354:1273-1521(+)
MRHAVGHRTITMSGKDGISADLGRRRNAEAPHAVPATKQDVAGSLLEKTSTSARTEAPVNNTATAEVSVNFRIIADNGCSGR